MCKVLQLCAIILCETIKKCVRKQLVKTSHVNSTYVVSNSSQPSLNLIAYVMFPLDSQGRMICLTLYPACYYIIHFYNLIHSKSCVPIFTEIKPKQLVGPYWRNGGEQNNLLGQHRTHEG